MTKEREFEEFAIARTPQLHRSAYLLCGDRHGAEDLVQETLAKVYVTWGPRIDNPAAYAQTTLVRTFLSQRRRRSSHELPYADLPDSPSVDPAEASDLRFCLQDVLDGLAPLDRAVLVLRFSEDLGVSEVADRLGLSPGAVKNRTMRALERARERTPPMNERQLTALMERVGETLEPDVPALVAGGAARGRVRRRRRAVAGALTGVAAVGAVALAAALLPRGGADAGPDVADTAPPSRVVAVAPSDMDETLAALLPGARPVLHDDAPYQHQLRRGAVRWHGATVTVTIDSRSVGTTTSARERCETIADGVECTAGAGGAWVYVHGSVELNVRTGREESYQDLVRVYDADGYLIEAGGEKGPEITRDLLRSLALDPVWFR